MKKSILTKHPVSTCSCVPEAFLENDKLRFLIAASVETVNREELLVLNFYSREGLLIESDLPIYRVFISSDDYLTQRIEDGKWFTGRICKVTEMGAWWSGMWYDRCQLIDEGSVSSVKAFLKPMDESENLLKWIHDRQEAILEYRLDAKRRKVLSKVDADMAPIGNVPEDFEAWILEHALYDSRYIYYTYSKRKVLDGYCTHCRQNVKVTGARHNMKGTCPACGSHIWYKAISKATKVYDTEYTALIQPHPEGLVVRYHRVTIEFMEHFKRPNLRVFEIARTIMQPDGVYRIFEWAVYNQKGEPRWCPDASKQQFMPQALYTGNLNDVLRDTKYRYSALELFASVPGQKFFVHQYLTRYSAYPQLEYLVKLGFQRVAAAVVANSYDSKVVRMDEVTPQKILGLSTAGINRARERNVTMNQLIVMQGAEEMKVTLTDEQLEFFATGLRPDALKKIAPYTTLTKAMKYMNDQLPKLQKMRNGTDYGNIFHDWMDYIRNAKLLGYDMKNEFVLFPRDLKRAHDNGAAMVKQEESAIYTREVAALSEAWQSLYGWQFGPYMIHIPKTPQEIVKEGQTLHHCVGTYIPRIVKGETVVVMLRKKADPERPFCTVEISNGRINQCRGKHNASMDKKIEKVMDRFKQDRLMAPQQAAM